MRKVDLSEYGRYDMGNDSNIERSSEIANDMLLDSNNSTDSVIELDTAIKKLNFDLKDVNMKINETIKSNNSVLISEFAKIETFQSKVEDLDPSISQLQNAYNRLDTEILKPFNECNNLQKAMKKMNQTNKILKNLSYALYLIAQMEEIDKSDANLGTKPFKTLHRLVSLLFKFDTYLAENSSLQMIKIIKDYIQFSTVLKSRCKSIIQQQIKALINYSTNDTSLDIESLEKHLFYLMNSLALLDTNSVNSTVNLIYSTTLKYCINVVLRNLNNTKYLINYIKSLQRPAQTIKLLGEVLKSCSIESEDKTKVIWKYAENEPNLLNRFWKEFATGTENNIRELVNRGGPVVKNLKTVQNDMVVAIKELVLSCSDNDESACKLEITIMLNSLTNFEKRK